MSTSRILNLPSDLGFRSAETPRDLSLWESKKEVLYDLYIHQKKTLKDVKTIMESDHGFPTTLKLSDYERTLRDDFKFRKNLGSDDWLLSIGPNIEKRKAAGKRSAVFLNDSELENVERKIQRSSQSRSSRRRAKGHTATLPFGVVIRTPPASPQLPSLASSLPFSTDPVAHNLAYERFQSPTEFLTGYERVEVDRLRSFINVIPFSGAGLCGGALSTRLWREGCPINECLAILAHQLKFNDADLRLFGPNATLSVLGKICFVFSNNLTEGISRGEMRSILDWIGFTADISSLKRFFSQKTITILAAWEALNLTVYNRKHSAAFDTLLSVRLSNRDEPPWLRGNCGEIRKKAHRFLDCLEMAPNRVATLIEVYSCSQFELSRALEVSLSRKTPIKLVKQLVDAGASLQSKWRLFRRNASLDEFIRNFSSQDSEVDKLAILKILVDTGGVLDELPPALSRSHYKGWPAAGRPVYATDLLLLSEGHSRHHHDFLSFATSYSDRQQTTMTVPGIFEAAQDGHEQLQSYLESRTKPDDAQERKWTLEAALSEASWRGYVNVVQTLLQHRVDPNGRMLDIWGPIWHPVIRAANNGKVDVVRILVNASSLDSTLLNTQFKSPRKRLDYCAWRNLERSQLKQILRLLSTLDFAATTRTEILLKALEPHRCDSGHDGVDHEFVDQLLESGLATLGQLDRDDQYPQFLPQAIVRGCDVRTLKYLVNKDMQVLFAPPIGALLMATLRRCEWDEHKGILEFLTKKVEGAESYIRENSSSLLSTFLGRHQTCGGHGESDCDILVTAKWLLGVGATLDVHGFVNLMEHADESFMLAVIGSLPNINAVQKFQAVKVAFRFGRFNLAKRLIETGVKMNRPHPGQGESTKTILQHACDFSAPLWFIRHLVDKGADVNGLPEPCRGLTALQLAAGKGSMNVVELLLNCGADVNALSGWNDNFPWASYCMRAIDVAAYFSRLDMVHFLIKAGARSGRPGSKGFYGAIREAKSAGNFAMVAVLKKHADAHHGELMEAEKRWLQANPDVHMYRGHIVPKYWED